MPNKSEMQPPTSTKNKNNTIWWIVGACVLIPIILVIIVAIVIFAGGYFISKQIPEINSDEISQQLLENYQNEFEDDFEKELQKELDKLEKEMKEMNEENEEVKNDSDKSTTKEKTGIIEGSLSYPSEVIPDLTVCAHEISSTSTDICTSDLIDDPKYTAGRGYQLEVPAGTYHVYSYFNDTTYQGIYSDYVTCGLQVGCDSHDYIDVIVEAGDHHHNIDPVDWYVS